MTRCRQFAVEGYYQALLKSPPDFPSINCTHHFPAMLSGNEQNRFFRGEPFLRVVVGLARLLKIDRACVV
jgi:hypothetical protein